MEALEYSRSGDVGDFSGGHDLVETADGDQFSVRGRVSDSCSIHERTFQSGLSAVLRCRGWNPSFCHAYS